MLATNPKLLTSIGLRYYFSQQQNHIAKHITLFELNEAAGKLIETSDMGGGII